MTGSATRFRWRAVSEAERNSHHMSWLSSTTAHGLNPAGLSSLLWKNVSFGLVQGSPYAVLHVKQNEGNTRFLVSVVNFCCVWLLDIAGRWGASDPHSTPTKQWRHETSKSNHTTLLVLLHSNMPSLQSFFPSLEVNILYFLLSLPVIYSAV